MGQDAKTIFRRGASDSNSTDDVMLSGETAAGKFPSESVAMMNDIIKFTEKARATLK